MTDDAPTKPQYDTRDAQAARVADYLEQHHASTQKEIDAVCDTGCISRVLSAMKNELGYGIQTGRRLVLCASGSRTRSVRTYTLTRRPGTQSDLFTPS